ncbi:MAG: GMC family oxidoreductase [Gammaproteobacteria bacterium]|nr:GMC family oxidoreductase [Gammaproteobacteria bacterium]
MFVNAQKLDKNHTIEADICIVGAGAAGITLGRELDGSGKKICILEGGGNYRRGKSQSLYDGDILGQHYELSTTRSRYYGGSTNCWGGFCRPLSEQDFLPRSWVDNSGWPINHSDLDLYYRRAHEVCGIRSGDYDIAAWLKELNDDHLQPLPIAGNQVTTEISQLAPQRRLGEKYRKQLNNSQNVTIYLHINTTHIQADEGGKNIQHVKAITANGRRIQVKATTFILATGGIENARMLLLSDDVHKNGLGNANDMVGRYFMEHPKIISGKVHFDRPFNPDFYDAGYCYFQAPIIASLSLSDKARGENKLLGCKSYIETMYMGEGSPGVEVIRNAYLDLRAQTLPKNVVKNAWLTLKDLPNIYKFIVGKRFRSARFVDHYRLVNILEPEPTRESRVCLSKDHDRLGLRKVALDWRINTSVATTLLQTQKIIDEEMRNSGVGRLEIDPALEQGKLPETVDWVWHHMGATRMDPDPKKGVVDTDCKVHGLNNLYVAGSSVFPTCGYDTPTITLIALALRLADRLQNRTN